MKKERLRVKKIKGGTVIDHIPSGRALTVLEILNVDQETGATLSILMNVPSEKFGEKDIVKVEGRELEEEEINKIALTAPEATINVIRDYEIAEKKKVQLPDVVEGVVKCSNPECITNASEPVEPKFEVISKDPVSLRCKYCERFTEEEDILEQL
ncbi:aspartate carbamoyltransferase [candidate division MSBL1 archaeon SCGC-AAA259E19]|uniref:Aspartate carbamoyltransferase regulatory chain n=1 Tax=candidate division MSBL1 archaeon SCGC-AAA259E19 TaxID=1698264 RepID=A0A133UNG7_9EURY|nr:aspartate carbamoyltransferase [candidate division MSBL1 archaeon SCGC-AAA259E19]